MINDVNYEIFFEFSFFIRDCVSLFNFDVFTQFNEIFNYFNFFKHIKLHILLFVSRFEY